MSKVIRADFRPTNISRLKQALFDEEQSFVLITCTKPSEKGEISVEMDCNGDPVLIEYLMKNAQTYLE
jgi:hypothetical protein